MSNSLRWPAQQQRCCLDELRPSSSRQLAWQQPAWRGSGSSGRRGQRSSTRLGSTIGRGQTLQTYNEEPPRRLGVPPGPVGVVPGARTAPTPRLTPERVLERLAAAETPTATKHWGAFYSSVLGGIVTDPGFMVVPVDDLMVHRGYAIVEAVWLVDGYLFQLDQHLARFEDSADLAGIPLPVDMAQLRRVLLDTAAASMKMNGRLTFWMSRGRGGFGATGVAPEEPSLYAMLTTEAAYAAPERDDGWRAVATPVDAPSLYFTAMRNTSQIAVAVAQAEAEARGADLAVFVDAGDGSVLYGADCSMGLLTHDDVLVLPPDEGGLANMAANLLAERVLQYVDARDEPELTVKAVERRLFTAQELVDGKEGFAISEELGVVGLSHWEGEWIGDHEYEDQAGPCSLALNALLEVARTPEPNKGGPEFTEVPYGYLSGMASQLT